MRRNFLNIIIYLAVLCLVWFAAEKILYIKTGDRYHIPDRIHWDLDSFTDICAHRAQKNYLVLRHTSVDAPPKRIFFKKQSGVFRVLFLGGSSTEGFMVAQEDTFVERARRMADSKFGKEKFEFINCALGGYTSYQHLIYFREILLRLKPDLVILYFGHNDNQYFGSIRDWRYYELSRKILDKHACALSAVKTVLKYGLNGLNPVYRFLAKSRVLGYLFFKFRDWDQYNKFKIRLMRYVQRVPPADQAYVLEEFIALSQKHGFLLVFMPEVMRKDPNPNAQTLASYYNLMKAAAKKYGVMFIDLAPFLWKYDNDIVFFDEVHLTPFGHSIVSDRIFKKIFLNFSLSGRDK